MGSEDLEQIRQELLRLKSELQELEQTLKEAGETVELDQAKVGWLSPWMPRSRSKWQRRSQGNASKSFLRSTALCTTFNQAITATALYAAMRLTFADFP